MKKILALCLVLSSFLWLFSGCVNNNEVGTGKKTSAQNTPLENPLNPNKDKNDADITEKELKSEYGSPKTEGEVDIDLTKLSSTMVFAEVNNMMRYPNDYLGKSIKVKGQYYANFYEPMKKFYHFVIILDALACCEQGLEFDMGGDYNYPEDYPPDTTDVEIVGVFESYQEEGQTWYRIKTEGISII